ncbi:MAG: IS66 family transposase [Gammaproteobacteria bacterium]|nr:IS66 family transposase [Gammaproteobacteria bacterium]
MPLDNEPLAKQTHTPRQRPSVLNPNLPRERIEFLLSDAERELAVETFFEKVKEELHIVPAQFSVREYYQEKALIIDDQGERSILNAERPEHPLGKCQASTALLAYCLVSKYTDAIPLYRMAKIMDRNGLHISDTSLARWMVRLGDVLEPLYQHFKTHCLSGDLLQMDETPVQVLDDPSHKGWMWVSRGGPLSQPAVIFDYDTARSSSVIHEHITTFAGRYLQCDGYSAYAKPCAVQNLTRVGCWDHARRKFVDAQKAQPKQPKANKAPSRADQALAMIGKLYAIEKAIKDQTLSERNQARQTQSKAQLEKLHAWLEKHAPKVAKDSHIGKALSSGTSLSVMALMVPFETSMP